MKVALVHDYLNQFGGAERVLLVLAELFPDAPIYTLFHEPERLDGRFAGRDIRTSFLDRSFIRKNHRAFIPLLAKAAESIKIPDEYDVVFSDSAGFGKGITVPEHTFHISYLHSPLRYAWEPEAYLGTLFPRPLIALGSPFISYLRKWDERTAKRPHLLLTNSHHTRSKIKAFYRRDAHVIYPPVDTDTFYPEQTQKSRGYFLAYGRIIHYKRFDLIVDAFNELELPLLIVGGGPHEKHVRKRIKSPSIVMRPMEKDENELRRIISNAQAVLFPQEEDFGLVAAEAITCGTPVIAYGKGGGPEIVKDGVNGVLFKRQTARSLKQAVERFLDLDIRTEAVTDSARPFSKEEFKKRILYAVKHRRGV